MDLFVELELCIMDHPSVLEAAVVAVPDDASGAAAGRRGDQEGRVGQRRRLRKHLYDKVARFWLPERWTFIDELPKTSVGKFDKKHIRTLYADGVYDVVECRD